MGNAPLRTYATSQIIKFYQRLKLGSENSLVQDVFKAICENSFNPFSRFLSLLDDCKVKLPNPRERKSIKTQTQKSIAALLDMMYDHWDQEILLNKKLQIFNIVKDSHDPDFYIFNIDDRYARKYIASMRLSTHPLRIEVGRYNRTLRENRLCQFCNMNEIEDELHFITSCTLYSDYREILYQELNDLGNPMWLGCNSNEKKLCYLLQPKDMHTSKLIMKYIRSCLDYRNNQTQLVYN